MLTDERIKTDVVDQLAWDTRIDASEVSVMVNDGHVTLRGRVPRNWAKWAAADDAWTVEGVAWVENELEVVYSPEVTIPTDKEIEADIRGGIARSPALNGQDLHISVADGWVTLEGTVDAFWKTVHARTKALDVQGVLGVKNKIAAVPAERFGDEVIGEGVMNAMDRNFSVSVDDVDVTVTGGKVVLNGTVPNHAAKSAAHSSALFTGGVTAVEDNLVVQYRK